MGSLVTDSSGADQMTPSSSSIILSSPGLTGRPNIPETVDRITELLANRVGGTLYIGVTNDLIRRVYEHKSRDAESFTKRHDVNRLVYFECFDEIEQAIRREKRLQEVTACVEDFADRERQPKLD
jgi:putative endonuclease